MGALPPGQTFLDLLELRLTQLGVEHDGEKVWFRWCEHSCVPLVWGKGPIEVFQKEFAPHTPQLLQNV